MEATLEKCACPKLELISYPSDEREFADLRESVPRLILKRSLQNRPN
jgi:hypothetical protein